MLVKYFKKKGIVTGEYELHTTINGNKYAISTHQGSDKLTYFAFGIKHEVDISGFIDLELNPLSEKSTYEEMIDHANYTEKDWLEIERQSGYRRPK